MFRDMSALTAAPLLMHRSPSPLVRFHDVTHNKINNRGMEEILQSLTGLPALHTLILDHACKYSHTPFSSKSLPFSRLLLTPIDTRSPDGQTAGALCSLVSQNPNVGCSWSPRLLPLESVLLTCHLLSAQIRALRLAGGWGPAMDAFLSLIAKNETLEVPLRVIFAPLALLINPIRQVLDISDNKLGDKGAALIANLLTTNPILKRTATSPSNQPVVVYPD